MFVCVLVDDAAPKTGARVGGYMQKRSQLVRVHASRQDMAVAQSTDQVRDSRSKPIYDSTISSDIMRLQKKPIKLQLQSRVSRTLNSASKGVSSPSAHSQQDCSGDFPLQS